MWVWGIITNPENQVRYQNANPATEVLIPASLRFCGVKTRV
jgi:hypothetical protein